MYKLSEEQRGSLLYIFEHLTVTGPDQAALLSNAAVIVRGLENEEEEEKQNGSKNSTGRHKWNDRHTDL